MLFEVRNLTGGYGKKIICSDISFSLCKGEILCVLGPNGSGKSTLFRLLLRFLPPAAGEVLIDGVPASQLSIRELAQAVAYIPQFHNPVFSYTALEIITMGRTSHFSAFSSPGVADRKLAMEAMDRLKISHLYNEKYTILSGGQRRMVLIARAICQDAGILIMDEPTSSLDYTNQQLVMDTIHDLSLQGYSIIFSTHGPEQPFSCAHKVLLMKNGRRTSYGIPTEVLTRQTLEEVYGIEMDVVTVLDRYNRKRYLCLPVSREL